ncbi:MAG: PQQ-dependent sugar dehydrogenase, partial [Nitrospirota bacterium]|nr:PQQ-dependent sugar dehydrogenase [Nitrospirota bacterium]
MSTTSRRGVTPVLLPGFLLLLMVLVAPPRLEAITFNDAGFFSETVATLAPYKPVGVTFAPDGRIFIWQRDGVVRIVKNGVLLPTPFLNFSSKVNTYSDHGFLGVALDPNFAANGWIYLFYTYEAGGNPNDTTPKTGHLSRVTADPDNPDVMLADSEIILLGTLDVPPCSNYPEGADCIPTDSYTHSVGSLRFHPDGTLFASHGDGTSASFASVQALRSQSLDSYAGKILRIKPDGTAPRAPLTPNPFNDGTNSIRSKVWAYGLRNPFRFSLHPTTGTPFIGDVGWNNWEEINKGAPGANYGWPCFEGTGQQPTYQASFPTDCQPLTPAVVTNPIYTYDHTVGSSVIGGAIFTGAQYPAAYAGNFFFADY